MLWLRRNLPLAAGGVAALALLGGGVVYIMNSLGANRQLSEEVEATRSRLNSIYSMDPFPAATNIALAKAEAGRLRGVVSRIQRYFFLPPLERLDVRSFRILRDRTIDELREAARAAGTRLPNPQYAFSFETQKLKTEFSRDAIPAVPEQMMEVKALCMMLFQSRVNQLANIRRARVSEDDRASTSAGDYLDPVHAHQSIPAARAESHPYELTFLCFSGELAQVLNSLARSTQGFVLKALMVEPEDLRMADAGFAPMAGAETPASFVGQRPPIVNPGAQPSGRFLPPGRPGLAPPPPGGGSPGRPAADRPIHLLKEKRLKVTMLVYAIKPSR